MTARTAKALAFVAVLAITFGVAQRGDAATTAAAKAASVKATAAKAASAKIAAAKIASAKAAAAKSSLAMAAPAGAPSWMKVDAAAKSVSFEIKMAENGNNGTFNFNGYGRGAMTITVPVGWNVKMHVINIGQGAIPHSLEIIPVTEVIPREGVDPPAYGGAETINLLQGLSPGAADDAEFAADKVGKYWIFCGVPNHGTGGMYDFFTVSATATAPTVTVAAK